MRCFIAIELPPSARKQLSSVQADMKGQLEGRFVEEENLHLTLKFLGDVSESKMAEISECLKGVKHKPFACTIAGLGVFTPKFIRVVWAGVQGEEVKELQGKIEQALSGQFPAEGSPHSHITLARIRKVDKSRFMDFLGSYAFQPITFTAAEFKLKSSQLTRLGPIYTNLGTFSLS